MYSNIIILVMVAYFGLLMLISQLTGRKANSSAFYLGNRQSPWYVVAFGMLGASLSGVTFISVPGWVQNTQFTYMQMVAGYAIGYMVVAHVLLPIYYRLNLTSIYSYLDQRFGSKSYLAGASFFLLSRTIGASFRLFLVANVLHITVFSTWNIPFSVSVFITLTLIYLYTFRGGIKTIIWTDTFQTLVMLISLVVTIYSIMHAMNLSLSNLIPTLKASGYTKTFVLDEWNKGNHFVKHFLSGIFITIVMTGLDQDMMQKNLSCRNLKDAQKNMIWYGFTFVPVNLLFLTLGALLLIFAQAKNIAIPERSDDLFPMIATSGALGSTPLILFVLGLVAAAYSSADSAITSLTTSFTVDILKIDPTKENNSRKTRTLVHLFFSTLLFAIIIIFKSINNQSVISSIFTAAGYTYGPLLGIYFIGIFTKLNLNDKYVPYIMLAAPFVAFGFQQLMLHVFNWKIGFELLLINGAITALGLMMIKNKGSENKIKHF